MWTLDGQRLVFIVSGERGDAVYCRRADGSGEAEHLIDTRAAEGWNAGGSQMRFLTLKESAGNRDYGIAVFDMSSRTVSPIIDLPNSAQHSSAESPDGTWMAYGPTRPAAKRCGSSRSRKPARALRSRATGARIRCGSPMARAPTSIVTIRCSASR